MDYVTSAKSESNANGNSNKKPFDLIWQFLDFEDVLFTRMCEQTDAYALALQNRKISLYETDGGVMRYGPTFHLLMYICDMKLS